MGRLPAVAVAMSHGSRKGEKHYLSLSFRAREGNRKPGRQTWLAPLTLPCLKLFCLWYQIISGKAIKGQLRDWVLAEQMVLSHYCITMSAKQSLWFSCIKNK